MIGLDTSVLARAILVDDPVWTPKAQAFLRDGVTPENPVFVNHITLAELLWTLRRSAKFSRTQLATVVASLLAAENIVVERPDLVRRALAAFERGPAGFADYLIAELNAAAGASHTVTVDRDAGKHLPFTPLS